MEAVFREHWAPTAPHYHSLRKYIEQIIARMQEVGTSDPAQGTAGAAEPMQEDDPMAAQLVLLIDSVDGELVEVKRMLSYEDQLQQMLFV